MLNFFRKIRRKLLDEGNLKKYLIYAIGEIFLVVIGILIALQINNWSENKKAKRLQIDLLEEVAKSIKNDLISEERKLKENNFILTTLNSVLKQLKNDKPYAETLGNQFSEIHDYWRLTLRRDPYESLKLYGTQFIKDDTIKLLLSKIYDNKYYNEEIYAEMDEYYVNIMLQELTEVFESISDNHSGEMKPYNYEELKEDKRYQNILKTWSYKIESLISAQNYIFENMRELNKRLGAEIERK